MALAIILIGFGLWIFGVRFLHAGPYSVPGSGSLIAAFACFSLAAFLILVTKPRWLVWVAVLVSPAAIFPAIFSTMGELEEVVSLFAQDPDGGTADLRLWIVDREDGAWVGMNGEKALRYNLDGAKLEMLRLGEMTCVSPVLVEDRPTVREIHGMKVDKYAVARFSGSMGMYPLEAPETTVVLRLDPC